MDVDFDVPEEPRVIEKRFKYKSYNEGLKDVHLPSALSGSSKLDQELEDAQSHFYESLNHLQQLNLSPSFIKFARKAGPLSASLPLLLHNWREVVGLWLSAQAESDDEGLKAILELLQKLAQDLRTTLNPVYPELLDPLLQLTSRSLSTESLTTLLSTLSALFKYLLIPASDAKLLEQTWESLRQSIPKCLPEVQRAVAEVWGSVLRRLKATMREEAVILVVQDLEKIEDAAAWCFVSACKSVSQSLHTVTTTLVGPLLKYYMTCENPDDTFVLLRRVLTAFIHHVKGPDQFSSVADLIVKELRISTNTTEERLRRALEIAALIAGVRNGSRLKTSHLNEMYKFLMALPLDTAPRQALLKFSVSLLMAGDMSIWMSNGRHYLSRLWDLEEGNLINLTLQLHGVLGELGWGGWKMIALPALVKRTGKLLESSPQETLRVLASLCRDSRLGDVDLVWKKKINDWVVAWLKQALDATEVLSEQEAAQLSDILTLSSHFGPEATEMLVKLADKYLNVEAEGDDFPKPAWVAGICMERLSTRPPGQWSAHVDLSSWTRLCIKQWYWSKNVIGGLVALSDIQAKNIKVVTFAEAYLALRESILSHSRALRLNSLKLLASSLVIVSNDTAEVLKRCLQGEEVSLDVQGVRERTVRIGRIAQMIKNDDEQGAELSARWLIAQLKVNLRPIWSPAATAISVLSQRFGDLTWDLMFRELKAASENLGTTADHSLNEDPSEDSTNGSLDDPWEEERSWRDPSAHKLRSAVIHWTENSFYLSRLKKTESTERFDRNTYEQQLLATLRECSSLAEKHNRDLVPFFLSTAGPSADTKISRIGLNSWLTLFAKFTNPKALHSTEILYTLYTDLLSHPDRSLQSSALSCILTYKERSLVFYQEKLRLLLDDTRWRDELTLLNISDIETQDRAVVVEVVIRLLFGIMLERKGRTRGADRRSAVLTALAGCLDDELALLVDLMLKPVTSRRDSAARGQTCAIQKIQEDATDKQMLGYLTLLGDVLRNLGSRLLRYWPALLGTTMDVITHAQERITVSKKATDGDDQDLEEGDIEDLASSSSSRTIRSIRQLGLKRLADFFKCPVSFDFGPWLKEGFPAFISPRLPALHMENTQAPSALLELFFVWTLDANYARFLVRYDDRVLPKIYDCLTATNVKPAVILRIFDIVDKLLALSVDDTSIAEEIVKPHISLLLSNLAVLIDRSKTIMAISTPISQRQIGTLSQIAHYSSNAAEASMLLQMFIPLLRKQAKVVPEKTKVDLLKIVGHLMRLIPELTDRDSGVYQQFYGVLSSLFQSLRSRQARLGLVGAFRDLAKIQISLQDLADLLDSLNSYSVKRLDEPDFDRRLQAFTKLNDSLCKSLSASDWLPILYNMLNFIQDPNELAIRNSSSLAMKNFIDLVGARVSVEHEQMFSRVLFPGLKNGLRSRNDLVRAEVLSVVSHAVSKCEHIDTLRDMRVLLASGDEEANFFNNIHHVQIHRRSRALRRLADLCDGHPMRNSTLNDILIPLISNYIVTTSSLDHHLVNDAITTTGRLAKHLSWSAYSTLIQKYLRLSKAKDESERVYVRTLVAILENFHFQMEEDVTQEDRDEVSEGEEEHEVDQPQNPLPQTLITAKIADAVNSRLLPSLLAYLESRDATTEDTTRIPIAIGIVKVAKHLPQASAQLQVTKLLTTTSQILRSKSQETRDLTRDTLCRIAVVLGPDLIPLVIKELRGALTRGPHLHVLATTVHHLLAQITTGEHADRFTILDECAADVAHVSAEVIFGESGKDVQAEGFKTKMREVKSSSSKGLDSFAITARLITPSRISELLAPLRSIMQETESLKVMQLVDDVLKQISSGLNANQHLVPTDLLSLCHTLITQNSRFLQQAAPRRKNLVKGDAIVQTKRQVAVSTDHFSNNSYRFVVFGLDFLHTALRRNRLDFKDKDVMSRLESMVIAVGNILYSTSSPVLISGLKVISVLIKCPLKSLDKSLPVFIRQALDILRQVGTAESDVAQTSLKCLATIFRDGPASVTVKEKELAYLLELISPDLEETSRQSTVFMVIRAIVSRKFVVPEIYDLMEKVSEIMVTNQSPQVQELCRGVLLQFLLDYPQGKGRLKSQMTFLAKNLSYVYESGRKSVMEILGAIISKFQLGLINEYAELLFVALVMAIANDDSAKCREMAAELVKSLIERLGDEKRKAFLGHLHKWAEPLGQEKLVRVSAQVYGIVTEALKEEIEPHMSVIVQDVNAILQHGSEQLDAINERDDGDAMDVDVELDWQASYYSLIVLFKLAKFFPDLITQSKDIDWKLIVDHLLFPHAWVRTASCRLLGTLFGATEVRAPTSEPEPESEYNPVKFLPFSKSGMKVIAGKLCTQLKSEHLDEALSLQIVKCLFFIGKCFALVPFPEQRTANDEDAGKQIEDEEDEGGQEESSDSSGNDLPWLFSKLSYQIRSALIARRNRSSSKTNWFHQPLSIIRWFAAMASHLEASVLERFLVHILSPVYRIIEDDTVHDSKMEELKSLSTELQDLVQSKVGTTKFSLVYSQIRQGVAKVRRERKEARVLQVAMDPQAAANRKMSRNMVKKESRKRKGREFAEGKGKLKRRREE